MFARGRLLARDGALAADLPQFDYPASARGTVKLGRSLGAEDFDIRAPDAAGVTARVIGVVENQAPTRALERRLPVADGVVQTDPANDVCKIALVERHRATGGVVNGFVSGFGYDRPCAVASTVAHDSHHMIVVGTDTAFMLGALAIVGPRLSGQLRVFLLTLAIVDDLIAITIIAVVYTQGLQLQWLLLALVPLAAFAVLVQRGVTGRARALCTTGSASLNQGAAWRTSGSS